MRISKRTISTLSPAHKPGNSNGRPPVGHQSHLVMLLAQNCQLPAANNLAVQIIHRRSKPVHGNIMRAHHVSKCKSGCVHTGNERSLTPDHRAASL